MNRRKIAVFTGNRAEYGLQVPILRAIKQNPLLEYKLLVSGAHLDKEFGKTLAEIKNDGFRIDAEIQIKMDASSSFSTAQAIGSGIIEISKALVKIKPDIIVVYADRFEGFAAVIAATQMNIPTAHVEGGDMTEGGALDDSIRHAMTKLAHLHFTTNQEASNRILAMGEESWRIHSVGFPAIDLIKEGNFAGKKEICNRLHLKTDRPIVLFTQHSVTTEFEKAADQLRPSLAAIKKIAKNGAQVILTYPNNDAGGAQIIKLLQKFASQKIPGVQLHRSLGRFIYHGILALAKDPANRVVCVGNSSSGIKETPAFHCPTVNIGSRQKGRLRGCNVLDVPYNKEKILLAIQKCFIDEKFRKKCISGINPYGVGDAGIKIAKVLSNVKINNSLIQKKHKLLGEVKNRWSR